MDWQLAAAIYALGNISGCHINPAVTIGLWSVKKFPGRDVIPYIVSQLAGASVASLLFAVIVGMGAVTIGGLGATAPFPGIGYVQAIVAEIVGTFLLMLAIMGVAVDRRAPPGFAGLIIGLTVAGVITTVGNISGCILKPCKDIWTVPWRCANGWSQFMDVPSNIYNWTNSRCYSGSFSV